MKELSYKLLFVFVVTLFSLYVAIPRKISILNGAYEKSFLARDLLLGLDLVGGSRVTFEANTSGLDLVSKESALNSLKSVVEKRVNLFGVSEANVQRSSFGGKDRIVVELPGVSNTEQAISIIGKTAQLDFEISPDQKTLLKTSLTGADLKSSRVIYEQVSGKPAVSLEFTDGGSQKFEDLTATNTGKVLPIVLDGQIISAPLVNEKIVGGRAQISGNFTPEEASALSLELNAGALPLPVAIVNEETLGASLGADSIQKSVVAGLLGVVLVLIFMIVLYGRLGLISGISLVVFAVVTVCLYKLVPVVLTLPGITGFLLSIGMAVDANILIYERFREERKSTQNIKVAMEVAFGRAWNSIRDANVATLVTAFVLANPLDWQFLNVSGPVRGFAFTLALGIAVGLFTGTFVTRNLMRFFIRK